LRGRRDSERENNLILRLRISPDEAVEFLTRRGDDYLSEMKQFCSKFIGPPGDKLFSCGAGTGGGCVDAYGHFQACMLLRHPHTVYSLKNGSLEDASKNFFPKLREIKATNPHYLSRCAHCFLKGLCEQCPARSWMEYGALDTPVAYLCEIAHAQARHLGLLEEGEKAWEVNNWKERIKKFSGSNDRVHKSSFAEAGACDG
ncbi:MAG: hypothetical protein ACE5L7_12145, partial [Candidatus Aminicenantales bacterium]